MVVGIVGLYSRHELGSGTVGLSSDMVIRSNPTDGLCDRAFAGVGQTREGRS